MSKNKQAYILALTSSAFALLIFASTPRLYPLIQPDSTSYLDFSPTRSALYPFFLKCLQDLGLSLEQITWVQLSIFLGSLSALVIGMLSMGLSRLVVVFFCASETLNIYFLQFQATILSESLALSCQNLLALSLMRYIFRPRLPGAALIGVFVGLAVATRPALSAQIPLLAIILTACNWGQSQRLLRHIPMAVAAISLVMATESWLFFSVHDARQSLLPTLLMGKGAILSIDPDFSVTVGNPTVRKLALETKSAMAPASASLEKINNPFLRARFLAEWEVHAQYVLLQDRIKSRTDDTGWKASDLLSSFGWSAIRQNPRGFVKLALVYYLGLWSVKETDFFAGLGHGDESRLMPVQIDANPGLGINRTILALLLFPSFLALGAAVLALTAYGAYKVLCSIPQWRRFQISQPLFTSFALALFVQGNLLLVAIFNVPTPRYLMSTYPFAVLAVLIYADGLIKNYQKSRPNNAEAQKHPTLHTQEP